MAATVSRSWCQNWFCHIMFCIGFDVAVYPVHVIRHLCVHSWSVRSSTSIAVACYSVQVPSIVIILKERRKMENTFSSIQPRVFQTINLFARSRSKPQILPIIFIISSIQLQKKSLKSDTVSASSSQNNKLYYFKYQPYGMTNASFFLELPFARPPPLQSDDIYLAH